MTFKYFAPGTAALALGIFALSANAQSTTQGAIAGTVFDATDAVVPGAKILIHNNNTNAEVTLTSGDSGFFKAPELTPGIYTVTITAPGFKQVRSSAVTVQVNETTEFNEHLTAGGDSEIVEVTAATPVLNFESAEYGGSPRQHRDRKYSRQQPPLVHAGAADAGRHRRHQRLRPHQLPRHQPASQQRRDRRCRR